MDSCFSSDDINKKENKFSQEYATEMLSQNIK